MGIWWHASLSVYPFPSLSLSLSLLFLPFFPSLQEVQLEVILGFSYDVKKEIMIQKQQQSVQLPSEVMVPARQGLHQGPVAQGWLWSA